MGTQTQRSLLGWIVALVTWLVILVFFRADFVLLAENVYSYIGPLAPVFVLLMAYALVQAVIIVSFAFGPLEEARYEILQEYLNHNSKLADIFPALGLLGTVLGMIMSVTDLKPETFFQCLSTTLLGGAVSFIMKLLLIFVDRITFLKVWRAYEQQPKTNNQ